MAVEKIVVPAIGAAAEAVARSEAFTAAVAAAKAAEADLTAAILAKIASGEGTSGPFTRAVQVAKEAYIGTLTTLGEAKAVYRNAMGLFDAEIFATNAVDTASAAAIPDVALVLVDSAANAVELAASILNITDATAQLATVATGLLAVTALLATIQDNLTPIKPDALDLTILPIVKSSSGNGSYTEPTTKPQLVSGNPVRVWRVAPDVGPTTGTLKFRSFNQVGTTILTIPAGLENVGVNYITPPYNDYPNGLVVQQSKDTDRFWIIWTRKKPGPGQNVPPWGVL